MVTCVFQRKAQASAAFKIPIANFFQNNNLIWKIGFCFNKVGKKYPNADSLASQ
jgi:hypothetical protein